MARSWKLIMKLSIRLVFALVMLTLQHCINEPIKVTVTPEEKEQKPPPPQTDFGVVIAFREQAAKVKAVYASDNVYQLLHDAIAPRGQKSDSEKLKLLNITTADIRHYTQSVHSLSKYCSKQDSTDFFANIDTATYSFDSARLINIICISVPEYLQIFNKGNCADNWDAFRNKYGHYGLHYLSIPLFNRSHTKALMITGGVGNCRLGSKELILLVKGKDKWRIKDEVTLEVY